MSPESKGRGRDGADGGGKKQRRSESVGIMCKWSVFQASQRAWSVFQVSQRASRRLSNLTCECVLVRDPERVDPFTARRELEWVSEGAAALALTRRGFQVRVLGTVFEKEPSLKRMPTSSPASRAG